MGAMHFSTQPARPLDLDALIDFARAHDLAFVALFGSRARGTHSPSSDFDLALMPDEWESYQNELHVGCDLERALRREDVDSVWLPDAYWVLAGEVARHGKPLYEKEPGEFARFRVAALLEASDSNLWRRRQMEGIRRALSEDRAVDLEVIRKNVAELTTVLTQLDSALDVSREEYTNNLLRQWAINYSVMLLVEYASTINFEVASSAGFAATGYHDAFENAARAGLVDATVVSELAPLTTLRNRLVHAYGKVKIGSVYDDVRASLPMWKAYREKIFKKLATLQPPEEQPG